MKKRFLYFLLLLFLSIFLFSLLEIFTWLINNKKTSTQIENISNMITVEEKKDEQNLQIIENTNIDDSNPYWDYIKMSLIDVDFNQLYDLNSEIKGWIQVPGTNINYPYVQAKDNNYYLNHSIDKSYNSAGWVFEDYRNNNLNDKNTIIYGHARIDKTMFGSLKNILSSDWLNNSQNHIVKISSLNNNSLWQVFSVYSAPASDEFIQTEFDNNNEYIEFLENLKNKSIYDFNTSITENDKILTLTTCYKTSDYRVVLHAKLIKYSTK